MELVIKIDEKLYSDMKSLPFITFAEDVIINGTPLPKGCDVQRIIPKRVNVQKWIYTECPNPNCDCELSTHHGDGYYSIEHKPDFCPACGQALLWESEEEE